MADFNIYRNMDKIDADALMMKVFGTTDISKIKFPKDMKVNLTANGKTILIKTLVSTRLKNKIKDDNFRLFAEYDLAGAIDTMKSASEVQAEIFAMDPNCHSDAFMFAIPQFNMEKLTKLSDGQKEQRTKYFISVAAILLDPKVLTAVAEFAPKKKNGGFSKSKLVRLASMGTAHGSDSMITIFGRVISENYIEILLDDRSASPDENGFIAEDFTNTFINELGLAEFIDGIDADSSKTFDKYLESSSFKPV